MIKIEELARVVPEWRESGWCFSRKGTVLYYANYFEENCRNSLKEGGTMVSAQMNFREIDECKRERLFCEKFSGKNKNRRADHTLFGKE